MCKGGENREKRQDGPLCGGVDSPGRRQARSSPVAVVAEERRVDLMDREELRIEVVISFRKQEKDRNTVRVRAGLKERRRTV
jgi:hypothetical protein